MKFTLVLVVLGGAENGLSVRVCVGARQEADRNRKIKRKSRETGARRMQRVPVQLEPKLAALSTCGDEAAKLEAEERQ